MNELKKRILESDFYQNIKIKRASKSIELHVSSIEAGMEEASSVLDCPLYELIYEVIEQGNNGILGVAKKPYYVRYIHVPLAGNKLSYGDNANNELDIEGYAKSKENKDRDTTIIVRIQIQGIMLKVVPPSGKGKVIKDFSYLERILNEKEVLKYDIDIAKNALQKQKNEYVKISDYYENKYSDGQFSLEVSPEKMKAFIKLAPLKNNCREVSILDIKELLTEQKIVHGIEDGILENVIEDYIVNVPSLVAEGTYVVDAENAKLSYNININKKIIPKDIKENISIDYKNLMNIENVVVGQVLAEKVDGVEGKPGYDVYGERIEPKSIKDIDISSYSGTNTELSSDGTQILSTIDGQVEYIADKLSVSPIYEVVGDVGPHTGNINFIGSVIVKGSVLDNYRIKANGNIEVNGNVGKSYLEADGNIMIKLGMQGHEEGTLIAGGNIVSKFVQYASLYAKGDILVTELIMNSNINADDRIILAGKKATASGGCLRALNEIDAKILGSLTSVRTIVEVGVLPSDRKKMDDLLQEKDAIVEEIDELSKNVKLLETQEKTKKLEEDKLELLNEDREKLEQITARLQSIDGELEQFNSEMANIPENANIAVSKEVHSGVKILVGAAEFEIRNSCKNVRFFNVDDNIEMKKYTDTKESNENK